MKKTLLTLVTLSLLSASQSLLAFSDIFIIHAPKKADVMMKTQNGDLNVEATNCIGGLCLLTVSNQSAWHGGNAVIRIGEDADHWCEFTIEEYKSNRHPSVKDPTCVGYTSVSQVNKHWFIDDYDITVK